MKTLFEKEYDDESLYDLGRDVHEALDATYNPVLAGLPQDEHGFRKGIFTVTITWVE